jgi:hypothetical protein
MAAKPFLKICEKTIQLSTAKLHKPLTHQASLSLPNFDGKCATVYHTQWDITTFAVTGEILGAVSHELPHIAFTPTFL